MPGNSLGIVVSIQAKIEGWLNQIKAIQDALKNIKVGTGISKDLTKDLKQVETLVNNLGKNINLRLTSDSQIIGFTDKLREVDEIFAHMGQRMTSISFADMDPSYITNNFKDLLDAIELANNALSSGMTNSFLNAISESTNLLKAFDKLGIDPSKMGAEELKKLLETKSSNLTDEIAKTNKEIDNLRSNAKAAKLTMEEMLKAKILQVTDTRAESKTIVGDTSNLGTRLMNPAALLELETRINDVILKGGAALELKLKDKRDLIDKAIKELVNALSVEEARKKLLELLDLFASVKAKGDFTRDIKVDKITDEQLTQWIPDPVAVLNKLTEIKSILADYKIDPTVLNKINIEELIKQGNFDKLTDEIDKALKKTLDVAEKDILKIKLAFDKFKDLADTKLRLVMSDSATRYNIDLGLSQWDGMLLKVLAENASLKEEVEKLKALLAERAIANVKALGGQTTASGALGILDSTSAAKAYEALLGRVKSAEQALGKLLGVVLRWFSIYAVIRMVNNAIHSIIDTIKELDKTITNIAIVTDMSQDDLWKLMPKYTQMARDYASSIAGVYEVSLLYYQQGLEMADVMSLTEATLKMARISGLGYADATDYMTNAVRSFKMEMSDATTVVDVYSSIAAASATSVSELATAMSKTASSAEAVGSSFLNTTAMMAVMIEATRESPENIGSAMKSIISRYGELKLNMTGTDAEGEEYSLNKVDTALQSIGISIHDVNGEFRDFDDVIMELAGKWDTVDKNTQRYIATVMAGNRQQSRFLALVSSGARLRELADEAANSEDASQLQFLKSLDSIDSKVQLLLTSILALYTNSGLELTYKDILDFANHVVTSLDNISNNYGLLGVGAKIASTFTTLATLVTNLFTTIKLKFSIMQSLMVAEAKLAANLLVIAKQDAAAKEAATEQERVNAHAKAEEAMTETTRLENEKRIAESMKASNWKRNTGMIAATGGLIFSTAAASMDVNTLRQEKAWMTGLGSALSGIGTGLMMGGWIGALIGGLTAIPGIIESIGMATESVDEKINRLKTDVTNAQNKAIISKDEVKTLELYEEKLAELSSKQYDSNADKLAYLDLSNEIAEKYPELISLIDEEGNKIVELGEAYANLKQLKLDAYNLDAKDASVARIRAASDAHYRLSQQGVKAPKKEKDTWTSITDTLGAWINGISASGIQGRSAKIFSQETDAYNFIANNLANGGFAYSMPGAYTAGYGFGSDWDIYKAVFGVNKNVLLNRNNLLRGLSNALINLDESSINTILSQSNNVLSYGQLLDTLIDANVNKDKINIAIQSILGKDAAINDELWTYRTLVLSSEKATLGALKLIKAENKNLYSLTVALDKYDISQGLENQFLQYDFQQQWEEVSLGLEGDLLSAAWEAFALNAEENIDKAITTYSQLILGLNDPTKVALLDSMFKNVSSYTDKEWLNLRDSLADSGNETLFNFINEYYTETILRASENFINSYKNLKARYDVGDFESRVELISVNVGREFLSSIITQYESIFKNKNLSNEQKLDLVNNLEEAYLATNQIDDIEKRNAALATLTNMDFSTLGGIYEAIEGINKLDLGPAGLLITNSLNLLSLHINVNLVTEFSSLSEKVISNMSDFEKAISNATKGMDLKTATEMATKLGKSITDFNFNNGKYYYSNLDDIEEIYLTSNNNQLLKDLEKRKTAILLSAKDFTVTTATSSFNTDLIYSEDYLSEWETLLNTLGLTVLDVINRSHEEITDTIVEWFDVNKINDAEYIAEWSNRFLSGTEEERQLYNDLISLLLLPDPNKLTAISAQIRTNINKYKRINRKVDVKENVAGNEEIESALASLEKDGETFSIDALILKFNGNKDAILAEIDSGSIETTEGVDKSTLKSYITLFLSRTGEDLNKNFDTWLYDYLNELYEENEAAIKEYTLDQVARTYLSTGNIEGFLDTTLGEAGKTEEEYLAELKKSAGGIERQGMREVAHQMAEETYDESERAAIENAIASGDITSLPEELSLYAKLVYDTYNKIGSTIFSTVTSALEKGTDAAVEVNEVNANKLIESGIVKSEDIYDEKGALKTSMVIIPYEDIKNMTDEEFNLFLEATTTSYEERVKAIGTRMSKDRPDIQSSSEKVNDDLKHISYDEITSMWHDMGLLDKDNVSLERINQLMKEWGLQYDAYGNIIGDTALIDKEIENLLLLYISGKISREEWIKQKYKLELLKENITSESDLTKGKALSDVIDNYTSVSGEQFSDLMGAFADLTTKLRAALESTFTLNANGTRTFDITKFRKLVADGIIPLNSTILEIIEESLEKLIDNARSALTNMTKLVTSGTTSDAEMKKVQDLLLDLGIFEGANLDDIFDYNELVDAWTLKPEVLYEYALKLAEALGLSGEELNQFIQAQTVKPLALAVDISSFLKAENLSKDSIATRQLRTLLKNWATAADKEVNDLILDNWILNFQLGGDKAVKTALLIAADAGKELTLAEIDAIYSPMATRMTNFASQLEGLTKGLYIAEGDFKYILRQAEMIDTDGLVTNIENIVTAYDNIILQLKDSAGSTAASINAIEAKKLTAQELGDIDAVAAMSDAMGMTYDTLGQILGKEGVDLEKWLANNTSMYDKIGAGKIRITDFSQFASDMHWQPGSEEYTSAFKTYNDSLIELNNKTEKSIFDEIKNISDANIGDLINLTQAYTAIEKFERHDMQDFVYSLRDLGAEFSDGILTLSDNANIPMIIKAIAEEALKAGGLIPELLASLNDVLIETLSKIANLIKDGISGTLSNVDAHNLSGWAKSVGIDKLDFVKTTDGLKLALDSAIELYTKLNLIDSLQGKLVFDELNKSLQESNEHYKSISDIANRIKEIESIPENARSELYKQELALAKEIYAVRSTTEDSSFSFMSNKIPGAQNNPINYFENWASAIHTFNDALKTPGTYTKDGKSYKSGFVDYDYWYNLVTEMNNIAKLGGNIELAGVTLDGSLKRASELILKGADALVVTDTGEVKVALLGISVDFEAGADVFSGNVTKGIQAMAKSLVEMLDGMILLLETVVAMEKLGDIEGAEDGTIDLTDLFPDFNTEGMEAAVLKNTLMINWINNTLLGAAEDSDIGLFIRNVELNGENLHTLLTDAVTNGKALSKENAEALTTFINSLYQMYQSDNFDLNNIYASMQEVMGSANFSAVIPMGDSTLIIENGTTLLQTKEGKYKTPNGKEYDADLKDLAIAETALELKGAKDVTFDATLGLATGTLTIGLTEFKMTGGKDGTVTYTANGITATSITDYIQLYIDKDMAHGGGQFHTAEQLQFELEVQYGITPLDSFTYKGLSDEIHTKLEKALASGKLTEVDAVIKANPVLSLLKGLTGEEISKLLGLDSVKTTVDNSLALEAINAVEEALGKLTDKTITITTVEKTVSDKTSSGSGTSDTSLSKPRAEKSFARSTGNIGLAQAKGTLMGELGPELVVSNGRYFVAGQDGPEMVDLADDAIVFNHLQTKSLLEKGTSPGRGKAITNERNAVAFATGNVNGGPAMASASAALEALKQLRAQWQALAGLSVQDLAGKGGGGGGGGGGDPKAFVKDLERWYNWLQQIELLEKEINLEEAKRARYQSAMVSMGREYADSQLVTLDKLKQEVATLHSLNQSKGAFFEKRRTELNEESAFKALYRFDENGQLKYKPGQFEWLSDLVGRDSVTGEANYTAKEQYERLVAAGYGEQMKYDSSGNEIKQEGDDWYVTAIQAFWDKIEAERQEMQSLHDDVLDGQVKEEELMTDLNEILNAIEDNLIAVEDKVLKAVEETRLREIDAIQDEKDAIEKSSQALITGLSDLLSKEQDMYSRQLDANELSRLQRLLSILQRSGGSASLIASLLKDITERLQDAYFDALKAQIDALLEASDNQLQKLQEQIDLMTELLAYEKEHGMLWEQVYQVMAESPEYITEFITKNTEEYWGKSPADFAEDSRDVLFQAEQFVLMRENVEGGLATLVAANSPEAIVAESEKITAESEAAQTSVEDTASTNTNTTGGATDAATINNTGTSNNLNGYKYTSKFAATYSTEKGEQKTAYAWGWSNKSAKEAEMMAQTRAAALAKNQKGNLLLSNIKVYDRGGMVEQDGPAFVHAKEGVLTAEQTSILRNEILGNKPNSALSMLSDLRELWNAAERTTNIPHTNDASVIIENATVEMNVSRIANDYDAQRAGELALDQMLAIARRTQAQNRVGR